MVQRGQFLISLEKGWIKFVCESHQIAELLKVSQLFFSHERKVYIFSIKEIRVELDNLLLEKIASPNLDLMTDRRGSIIIKTITKILTTE